MWSFFRQLNWYKKFIYIYIYIPYGQVIRIKRICSNPEQVKLRLEDLSNWLVNRGYKQEVVSQQIHRVDAIDRETLLIKHPKQNNIETLTLILTYHPALKNVHEILHKAHRHTLKSPRLQYVLPTPPRVAFRNDKSLKDKLVRSKLKNPNRRDPGNYKCGSNLCQICNIISLENEFTDRHRSKTYKINFDFDCNSQCVIYLITCKVCQKQYVGSTITTFRKRFNQYKSNIKLYSEGRRGMKQEKLISHFFTDKHHGTYDDIKVQIINYCDANDQERREDFWIFNLNTLEPNGLNNKRAQKN